MNNETPMVVFDLDGTLANCDKRVNEHLLDHSKGYPHKREKPNWDQFFLDCHTDEPIPHALMVLSALHNHGAEVWIWTGRSDIARAATEDWLMLHGVPPEIIQNRLVMRPADFRGDDHDLKPTWIAEYGTPALIFEDRNRVVEAWRAQGIPCYHVAPGDF